MSTNHTRFRFKYVGPPREAHRMTKLSSHRTSRLQCYQLQASQGHNLSTQVRKRQSHIQLRSQAMHRSSGPHCTDLDPVSLGQQRPNRNKCLERTAEAMDTLFPCTKNPAMTNVSAQMTLLRLFGKTLNQRAKNAAKSSHLRIPEPFQ